MAMTTTEQNTINQLLNTAKTGTQICLVDGQYFIARLIPLQMLTAAQAGTFATAVGGSIASP